MAYERIALHADIEVSALYTVHYFEYRSDFDFPGERHDFWEFQYLDKGNAVVRTDNGSYLLGRGQVIFHKSNEFHTLSAAEKSAPIVIVVSFECHSPAMNFFDSRILTLSDAERDLLGQLVAEARHCLASPLDDPYLQKMQTRPDSMFGAQQLVSMYLEQLLISLIRRNTIPQLSVILPQMNAKTMSGTYGKILYYLEEHVRETLTIAQICHDNLIGRSQLQAMFREQNGCGVIQVFLQMKTEYAKQLIRENQMNFTQISEFLGYSSVHYFSRQFKTITKMTPSEYSSSIQARSERGRENPQTVSAADSFNTGIT
ncbi:MAG: AraC family transcriptional regulator [Lachnospiraceae bacterium]|nr:AraC family transcriptional regulator [Lachnospiraceae bacterium]